MAVLSAKIALGRTPLNDEQLFVLALDLAKRLLNKQMPKAKIRTMMNFLRHYLRFDNPKMISKFEKEIAVLTERTSTMGIEEFLLDKAKKEGRKEGLEAGREKGIKETALKMKKRGLDIALIAQITGLSSDIIEKLT